MYKGCTIGVVVPAYNEEGFVGDVIDTIPGFVDRIYVIDDQSTDGTWAEIQERAAKINRRLREPLEADTLADGGLFSRRVVPLRHETNRGVGGAIKTGYQRAYADRIDVTAVMAGDGQMDPDLLDRLLDPIVEGGADYAKGNRLLNHGYRTGMPKFRLFGNAVLSILTKIASGYWEISDPQNGYTAISHRALDAVDLDSLYEDYGFANELLVRLNTRDVRVAEVAMPAVYGDEQSTIRYRSFVPKLSKLLLKNFLWRLKEKYVERDFHPVVLLYVFGILGTVTAASVGLLSTLSSGLPGLATGNVLALLLASLVSTCLAMVLDGVESRGKTVKVASDEGVQA